MSHISHLILAHKGGSAMEALTDRINRSAGADVMSAATLYSYVSRHRRPDPRQVGILARHMATSPRERGEVLMAYLEDTLDATDIPPSERYLRILLAVGDLATDEEPGDYAPRAGPDRDRDLRRLRDAWHSDHDLQALLHHLANLTG